MIGSYLFELCTLNFEHLFRYNRFAVIASACGTYMMRALFFAAFLAGVRRHYRQRIMRAAHFSSGCGCFFLWNCHINYSCI